MASELSANNPDLIESIRRNMNNSNQPGSQENNDNSSSDGNSNEPPSILK